MSFITSSTDTIFNIVFRNFQNEEKRMTKVEKSIKSEINEVIEASQDAHEQREDAKNKTIMLRSRAEKDLLQVLTVFFCFDLTPFSVRY